MDRRTDRPDGSGGGTPTVVTSRATDDDLISDEQSTRPGGIMAPPRDDTMSDGTAGGVPANSTPTSAKDSSPNGGPAAVDDTVADGVPALPADTIGSARGTRAKGSDPDQGASENAGDPPTVNFGSRPSDPASSFAAAPVDRTDAGTPSVSDLTSNSAPSGVTPSGPPGAGSPGHPSPAGSPSVSPASFAWEMPDAPAKSPASAARNFLRTGLALRGATAKDSSSGTAQTATGEAPAPARGPGQQAPPQEAPPKKAPSKKAPSKKAQSRRSARQAHLTIARVEPWSVMKFSFVVSLVAFVILFIAVSVLYSVLSAVGVFDSLQRVVTSLTSSQGSAGVNAKAWFTASKVLGYTALLGSLNIVLITAMSTIGAVVYNLTSRLVGGVEVTLRETD